MFLSSRNYMIWVVNSESWSILPIPDPGSRGQKRHRIPDPDPQHCFKASLPSWTRTTSARSRHYIRKGPNLSNSTELSLKLEQSIKLNFAMGGKVTQEEHCTAGPAVWQPGRAFTYMNLNALFRAGFFWMRYSGLVLSFLKSKRNSGTLSSFAFCCKKTDKN